MILRSHSMSIPSTTVQDSTIVERLYQLNKEFFDVFRLYQRSVKLKQETGSPHPTTFVFWPLLQVKF